MSDCPMAQYSRVHIFRYCSYRLLLRVLHLGWVWTDTLAEHHGEYACLVEWPGDEEDPPWPAHS